MKFHKVLEGPKELNLPGWPNLIDWPKVKARIPPAIFIAVFGSSLHEPTWEEFHKKWLFWKIRSKRQKLARDVDILAVVENGWQATEMTASLDCIVKEGDNYGFRWVAKEVPGALHLLIAGRNELERALEANDPDARRILSSCKIIEGDLDVANTMINMAKV